MYVTFSLIFQVAQAMLSAFLGLQYQFSAVVIERFTAILQALRDDSQSYGCQSMTSQGLPSQGVPSQGISSQAPMGLPMGGKTCQGPLPGQVGEPQQLPVSSQYVPQVAGQPSWPPSGSQPPPPPSLPPGLKGVQPVPLLESPGKEDKPRSRHPSGGHSRHSPAAPGWSNPGSAVGVPNNTSYNSNSNYASSLSLSMNSSNTLSPGSCYGLFSHMNGGGGAGWHTDAISRRWSMGGPSTEGWERSSSLGPFSLIANRRWSVPEASEHDVSNMSEADSMNDFYGLQGDWSGTIGCGSTSWGSRGVLQLPSRDSSVTRSPSHSRSVTPGKKEIIINFNFLFGKFGTQLQVYHLGFVGIVPCRVKADMSLPWCFLLDIKEIGFEIIECPCALLLNT